MLLSLQISWEWGTPPGLVAMPLPFEQGVVVKFYFRIEVINSPDGSQPMALSVHRWWFMVSCRWLSSLSCLYLRGGALWWFGHGLNGLNSVSHHDSLGNWLAPGSYHLLVTTTGLPGSEILCSMHTGDTSVYSCSIAEACCDWLHQTVPKIKSSWRY